MRHAQSRNAVPPDESVPSTTATPRRRGLLAALAAGAAVAPALAVHAADNGSDVALIELAEQILELERQSNRLSEQEETLPSRERHAFSEKHIRPLTNRSLDLRDQLARTAATTMAGFRAKARVLQVYTNCAPGFADPWQDDGLAWSLANDLVGVPSIWREDDEAGHKAS